MNMKIDRGIPPPEKRGRPTNNAYEVLMRQLEIGDSFVPEGDEAHHAKQTIIRRTAKRLGIRVTISVAEDGSMRVWRIAPKEPK